ncbi:5-oxoprolinase subunit B family protein [Mycobacterium camsae]|uniref:5-oxoprolinase subunit B family protein n=1 Tax=Mycobacterium gordonae TaxID=1778 RepID=UPI001980B498|nr:allophanate hydrolase subunit 1 [Mycobacterium gordonae]
MSVTEITDFARGPDVAITVVDYGDQALILQCVNTAEVLAWTEALRAARLPGVVDIVPASATVLVKLDGPRFQGVIRQRIRRLRVAAEAWNPAAGDPADDIVIDVVYDGPDLPHVASHTGLSPAQVISAHTGTRWRVGFGGFAPGFAYLIGGDERLRVPRRSEPRTSVPAGAVGLAGEFSAVYPRRSPGGWQIIGHTDAVLWDIDRPEPALLTQGRWVRFRAG